MFLNPTDIKFRFRSSGALAYHRGSPEHPHFLLSSGKHSDTYFNCEKLLEVPYVLDQACVQLLRQLCDRGFDLTHVDCVAGPAMGAITIAHDVARHIASLTHMLNCKRAYAEKEDPNQKEPRMVFKRMALESNAGVLLVEDVITTGGTTRRMAEAVAGAGASVLPYVLTLVNRSGEQEVDGREVISLFDLRVSDWEPDECPLCKAGSEALRPKEAGNWRLLTGEE